MSNDFLIQHYTTDTYVRETIIPAKSFLKSYKHSYSHSNILAAGTLVLSSDGFMEVFTGPCCIVFNANVEYKMLAITNVAWYCIHKDTTEIPDLN